MTELRAESGKKVVRKEDVTADDARIPKRTRNGDKKRGGHEGKTALRFYIRRGKREVKQRKRHATNRIVLLSNDGKTRFLGRKR